jgi:hypothetical protein
MNSYLFPGIMFRLTQWALLGLVVLGVLLVLASMVGGLPSFLT